MGTKRKTGDAQLSWAARNMHKWPDSAEEAGYAWENQVRFTTFNSPTPPGCVLFSRQQWLDRRAELQNKPRWNDHPDAKVFVQNDSGVWFKNTKSCEVRPNSGGGWSNDRKDGGWRQLETGEILGDWRDTLEKRPYISVTGCVAISSGSVGVTVGGPADLSEQASLQEATDNAPELKSDRYKFEPFTSVEDAQPMGEDKHALHTIHHAAFLHRDSQLLLNEPELVVFRTADGELIHCKPKECLIDPDQYGLAARLLSDMSGHAVAPEHIRELAEQMGWSA